MRADGAIAARIEACETTAYHHASQLQPHGVLLAFDPDTGRIVRVSANAGGLLGHDPGRLLGATLATLFAADSVRRIDQRVAAHRGRSLSGRTSLALTLGAPVTEAGSGAGTAGACVDSVLYPSGALFCIEIDQPGPGGGMDEAGLSSSRFFELVELIGRAGIASDRLPTFVCEAIRDITGFDRIYFCRFDRHGHGHVLGESGNGRLPSLLNHHFPATDVPRAARAIYVVNPFRLIPDVDARPVAILGGDGDGGGDGAAMDLTLSCCRAIAPTHLQYLRNMGVRASVSFSVAAEDRLTAMFGGHHAGPRHASHQRLAACRHLVELFHSRYEFLRIREERGLIAEQLAALHVLAARFRHSTRDLGCFIAADHDAFRGLMQADDLLCRFEGQVHLGRSLRPRDAHALLECVARRLAARDDVFHTDCISEEDSAFKALCPHVAGVLAIPLDLSPGNLLVWLRAETVVAEQWSGDPERAVVFGADGAVGPRTSFAAYVRQTSGTCRGWSQATIDLARQSRHAFSQVLAVHYESGMRAAAERANALKSDFLTNISHELRSPLHAIIGLSGVLAGASDGIAPDQRRRYAGTIRDSGERLLRLVDDLLDLSRLEAGKMGFAFVAEDLVATIERGIAEVAAVAAARDVAIVQRSGQPRLVCPHDPARMRQVMINLLSNAIRFSAPSATVTVALEATQAGPAGPALLIEVADQGPGIPDGELETVFDKFIQSSRTRNGAGGTGLGLSICREIVDAHRGRIWAANNRAGGASLFVSLPLNRGTDEEAPS